MSASYTFNGTSHKVTNTISDIRKDLNAAVQNLETNFRKITLVAATEASDAIVVTGTVTDVYGTAVTAACEVMVRSLAVTADKGDFTVTTGTSVKEFEPATGVNEAWVTTNSSGVFAISIADTAAEGVLIQASTNAGYSAILKLTFA